jgi:putative Ca2+/H+ antiporter (TMEM165/GDT1 family)
VAGTEDGTPVRQGGSGRLDPFIVLLTFPVIFLGEVPDKTMFASLVMATRGRPGQVWLGAAGALMVHALIAVTVGVALLAVLPGRALDAVVAAMFLAGAVYAWREGTREKARVAEPKASRHGAILTAFVVIFLAEWGDLTQMLTANLAARYQSALAVALGSTLALWAVAALAVVSGQTLLRYVNLSTMRKVTAAVLLLLAVYTAWSGAQ